MITNFREFFTATCILIPTVIILCCIYAYRVNARRAPDDPEKKEFYPQAIWLAPFTLPILLLFDIFIMVLSSVMFALLLVLFPFALLLFRKPFLIKWILTLAQKIGNMLLTVNTELLKAFGVHWNPLKLLKFQVE